MVTLTFLALRFFGKFVIFEGDTRRVFLLSDYVPTMWKFFNITNHTRAFVILSLCLCSSFCLECLPCLLANPSSPKATSDSIFSLTAYPTPLIHSRAVLSCSVALWSCFCLPVCLPDEPAVSNQELHHLVFRTVSLLVPSMSSILRRYSCQVE